MILKGGSRRGANDLALHLSNEVDNERVAPAETRGMVADNLYDGFREWELICDQSNATEPFYSLSINPDPNQRDWTDEEWQKAIDTIENKLGLSGQPRAVIFHEKIGEDGNTRRHCHVVWSRIQFEDDKLKAVHMGQDYYKLRSCAQELAKTFKLTLPNGLKPENEKAKSANDNYDLGKSHGNGRDPQSIKERKVLLTKLWQEADTAKSFQEAIYNAGYVIAKGQKRGFVIVDQEGEVHSLARQIEGVKTKQIKVRLAEPNTYPSVEQAKEQQKIQKLSVRSVVNKRIDLTHEQKQMQQLRHLARRADKVNDRRQRELREETKQMLVRHEQERMSLRRKQRVKTARTLRNRERKKPSGLLKHLRTAFGYETLLKWKYTHENRVREKSHSQHRERLRMYHRTEEKFVQRKKDRLQKQEKREAQSISRLAKTLGKNVRQVIIEERVHFEQQRLRKSKCAQVLSY